MAGRGDMEDDLDHQSDQMTLEELRLKLLDCERRANDVHRKSKKNADLVDELESMQRELQYWRSRVNASRKEKELLKPEPNIERSVREEDRAPLRKICLKVFNGILLFQMAMSFICYSVYLVVGQATWRDGLVLIGYIHTICMGLTLLCFTVFTAIVWLKHGG